MSATMKRVASRAVRRGVVADAWFKLAVAAAYAVFSAPLSAWLSAPVWLTAVTALFIVISALAELITDRTRARIHAVFLAGYDAVWLLASIACLIVLARTDGAGSTWLAVQTAASALLTMLLLTTAPAPIRRTRPTRK